MPSEGEPDRFVRNFAIIASIVTGITVLALILPDICRDRWEENNTLMVRDKLKEADTLSGSDFMAAFKIYEEVLSETSKHTIKNDTFRQALDVATANRDKLCPRVQQELNREQAEKNRLALQEQERKVQEEKKRLALQDDSQRQAAPSYGSVRWDVVDEVRKSWREHNGKLAWPVIEIAVMKFVPDSADCEATLDYIEHHKDSW